MFEHFNILLRQEKCFRSDKDVVLLSMLDAHAVIEAFGFDALFEGQHRDFVVGRRLAVKEALRHETIRFGGLAVYASGEGRLTGIWE